MVLMSSDRIKCVSAKNVIFEWVVTTVDKYGISNIMIVCFEYVCVFM